MKRMICFLALLLLLLAVPWRSALAWPWVIDNVRTASVERICRDGVMVLDVYTFPDAFPGERVLQTRLLPADFLTTGINATAPQLAAYQEQLDDYGFTQGIQYADLVTDDNLTAQPLLAAPVDYLVEDQQWPLYEILTYEARMQYGYARQTWQPALAVGDLVAVEMLPQSGSPLTKFIVARAPDCLLPAVGEIARVSTAIGGGAAKGASSQPATSRNGARVVFASTATDLVGSISDSNKVSDAFVHTLTTGETRLLSQADGVRATADGLSHEPDISHSGDYAVFTSSAADLVDLSSCNLADDNGVADIYGVDPNDVSSSERLSYYYRSEGGCVQLAAASMQANVVRDRVTFATLADLAVASGGAVGEGNAAADLLAADDPTTPISVRGSEAGPVTYNGASAAVAQAGESATSTRVAFESVATDAVSGDGNGAISDIIVLESEAPRGGSAAIVSRSSAGVQANGASNRPALSIDGRFVAFDSLATNLDAAASDGVRQVYVHDLDSGCTTLLSRANSGEAGNGASSVASLSTSGRFVLFQSDADNLVSGDLNGVSDIFVVDRDADQDGLFYANGCEPDLHYLWRVSVGFDGAEANGASYDGEIAPNGAWAVFASDAANLVRDDDNGMTDVFSVYLGYSLLEGEPPLAVSGGTLTVGGGRPALLVWLLLVMLSLTVWRLRVARDNYPA